LPFIGVDKNVIIPEANLKSICSKGIKYYIIKFGWLCTSEPKII